MFWKLPGIRHIRWMYYTWRVNQRYAMWRRFGLFEMSDTDRKWLENIRRGEV